MSQVNGLPFPPACWRAASNFRREIEAGMPSTKRESTEFELAAIAAKRLFISKVQNPPEGVAAEGASSQRWLEQVRAEALQSYLAHKKSIWEDLDGLCMSVDGSMRWVETSDGTQYPAQLLDEKRDFELHLQSLTRWLAAKMRWYGERLELLVRANGPGGIWELKLGEEALSALLNGPGPLVTVSAVREASDKDLLRRISRIKNNHCDETLAEIRDAVQRWTAEPVPPVAPVQASGNPEALEEAGANRGRPRRTGRDRSFSKEQLDRALGLRLAGESNRKIAQALYDEKKPLDSQRRGVSTILKYHFPDQQFPPRVKKPNVKE